MSKRLKNSKLRHPFSPEVLAEARKIAGRYHIVIEEEDGMYLGSGLEMPLVMADGQTPEECVSNVREALTAATALSIEKGTPIAPPMDQRKRAVQVNLRLTGSEKRVIESAARRQGYDGISDFLRVTALHAAGRFS